MSTIGLCLLLFLGAQQGPIRTHHAEPAEVPALDPYSLPLVNLRLAAAGIRYHPDGDYLGIRVREADQGGRDLNGDGDARDDVVMVHDFRTGETLNLGVAGFFMGFTSDERYWVGVDESAQGETDLNGDGDATDRVFHLFDLRDRRMTNLRVGAVGHAFVHETNGFLIQAGREHPFDLNADGDTDDVIVRYLAPGATHLSHVPLAMTEYRFLADVPVVVLTVHEGSQGNVDLNGDGDAVDRILFAHDLVSGTSERIGEVPPSGNFQPNLTDATPSGSAYYHGHEDGYQDLNGDGDQEDMVFQIYNHARRDLLNTGISSPRGEHFEALGSLAMIQTTEGEEGVDLNGDGDVEPLDRVSFVYDAVTHSTTSLGLATYGGLSFSLSACRLVDGHNFLRVPENRQGNTDLNGDGDVRDQVLHVYDNAAGTTTNLGLDLPPGGCFTSGSGKVAFSVSEPSQGHADLNGDGDARDNRILHLYDLETDRVTNLGLAYEGIVFGGEHALVQVKEKPQGRRDLNGDGDIEDLVVHVVDLRTGRAVNLGFAGGTMRFIGPHRATFLVSERNQGRDLNADGDTFDIFAFAYDTRTGELFYLKRRVSFPGGGSSVACCERALVFSLFESELGRDLNGDGDAQDAVLHYLPWSD